MARNRKTIDVNAIAEKINAFLAIPTLDQLEKKALCTFLESTLHDTGNYHGFQYNYWNDHGYAAWIDAGMPTFPEKEKFVTNNKREEWSRHYYIQYVKGEVIGINDFTCPNNINSF